MNAFSSAIVSWCFGLAFLCAVAPIAASTAPVIGWTETTDMPAPRDGYAIGSVGGRLIVIGGTYWEGQKGNWRRKMFTGATHAFNPATRGWEKLPDAPVSLGYPASAQVGDDIYAIGGLQDGKPGRDVFVLRHASGFHFERHSELPEPRLFASAVAVGTRIYVMGGTRDYEPFDEKGTCCTSHTATTTVWMLDTTDPSRTWQHLSNYPGKARWLQSAAATGRNIYVFGGICLRKQYEAPQQFNDVLDFDTVSGKWRRVGTMPPTLQSAAAVAVGGKIVLLGPGRHAAIFDPQSGGFSPVDPLPRDDMVTGFVWIRPYIVGAGGENSEDGPRRRSPWTFVGRTDVEAIARATAIAK